MKNIYITSDIHGDLKKFKKLLEEINLSDDDVLIVVGDVIDRGEDGLDILKIIMEKDNIILLKGNHEDIMLNFIKNRYTNDADLYARHWFENGGYSTFIKYEELNETDKAEIYDYLNKLEYYKILTINNVKYVIVHAGFIYLPQIELESMLNMQKNDLLWVRRKFLNRINDLDLDYKVIHGHTPVTKFPKIMNNLDEYTLERINEHKIIHLKNTISIDCGAGYNHNLSCIRLNDLQEFYID